MLIIVVFVFVMFVLMVLFVVVLFAEMFENQFLFGFDGGLVNGVSIDFEIAVLARESTDMECHIARSAVDAQRCFILGTDGIVALLDDESGLFRHVFRDAIVDHVDHAAYRAAAVQQRRRAAQDFETLGEREIHRVGMIRADDSGVMDTDAVLQNLHPVGGLAADDGSSHSGAERVIRHADLRFQRVAEVAANSPAQFFTDQNIGGQGILRDRLLERSGNENLLNSVAAVIRRLRPSAVDAAQRHRQADCD